MVCASVVSAALPSCWAIAVTEGGRDRLVVRDWSPPPSALDLRLVRLILVSSEPESLAIYDTGAEGEYSDDDDDGDKKLVPGPVTGTGGGSIVISLAAALSCARLMTVA